MRKRSQGESVRRYMLLPFCYMSFYVSNRKFFQDEVAAKLYHPSAYYLAQAVAGHPNLADECRLTADFSKLLHKSQAGDQELLACQNVIMMSALWLQR